MNQARTSRVARITTRRRILSDNVTVQDKATSRDVTVVLNRHFCPCWRLVEMRLETPKFYVSSLLFT
jgi:hypothetical protein